MKRILLVITIIILLSVPSLANSEKIISLSSGMSTGVMGFTVEKLNGGLSYYTGFGVTPSTLRLAFGSRIYLPEKKSYIFSWPQQCIYRSKSRICLGTEC